MLKKTALRLMMGHRAGRLHEERLSDEEMVRMKKELRSVQRAREMQRVHGIAVIKEQQRWIKRLEADAHNQKMNLGVARSVCYKRQDKLDTSRLHKHMSEFEHHKDSIREVHTEIGILRSDIQAVEAALTRAKRKIGNRKTECNKCRVPNAHMAGRQLELAFHHFGMQLAENRRLLSEIHHLDLEKAVVNKIHKAMEREMRKLSRQLADHIDVARELFEKLNTTEKDTAKLQEYYQLRTLAFQSDMADYDNKIELLKNTEQFMLDTIKQRPYKNAEDRHKLKQQLTPNQVGTQALRHASHVVREALHQDNLSEVIETFIQLVDENFMLYRNVAETRSHIHELQLKIKATNEQVAALRAGRLQQDREAKLGRLELEQKSAIYRAAAEEKQSCIVQAGKLIDRYARAIRRTRRKMGYEEGETDSKILKSVEPKHIMQHLAEIEGFVSKVWDIQTYLEFRAYDRKCKKSPLTIPEPVKARNPREPAAATVTVLVPSYDEEGEEDEEGKLPTGTYTRPLDMREVAQIVNSELETRVNVNDSRSKKNLVAALTDASKEPSHGTHHGRCGIVCPDAADIS